MKTTLRTLALIALAAYLGLTTTGLRILRESLPAAAASPAAAGPAAAGPAAVSSDWWTGALASESNKWATLARIGKGVMGE